MLPFLRNGKDNVPAYVVVRSTIRYGAASSREQRPAHQLPEVVNTEFLMKGSKSRNPRLTTNPAHAAKYSLVKARFLVWVHSNSQTPNLQWSVQRYADALFLDAIRSGSNDLESKLR